VVVVVGSGVRGMTTEHSEGRPQGQGRQQPHQAPARPGLGEDLGERVKAFGMHGSAFPMGRRAAAPGLSVN
jgi:hypothetical protein